MKKLVICLFAGLVFAACQAPKSGDETQEDTMATASTEPVQNQLTGEEKADGWKLLFNGQNMDGWKTYQNK